MPDTGFIHFSHHNVHEAKKGFDGYLSFLPIQEYQDKQHLNYRIWTTSDFYWLEIKDTISKEAFRLDLCPHEATLWIIFQFLGTSSIYLPHAIQHTEGHLFGFGTNRSKIPLLLREGKNWLFAIGCRVHQMKRLIEEFPSLRHLSHLITDMAPTDTHIGEYNIDHKQRQLFQDYMEIGNEAFEAYTNLYDESQSFYKRAETAYEQMEGLFDEE